MEARSRPTIAERRSHGRAARECVGRGQQSEWTRSAGVDPLDLLRAQEPVRIPELLGLRYERMAASPWTFLRGAAAVMAADLAAGANSTLMVQMCGDAHVLNFGLWATPERQLAFALRDFDETLTGPFEWDLKRLVTSLVVVSRENELSDDVGLHAVRACVQAYRTRMCRYARMDQMAIWYDAIHVEELLLHLEQVEAREKMRRRIEKRARKRGHEGAFDRLAEIGADGPRIRENPPAVTHLDDPDRLVLVREVLERYRQSLRDDRRALLDRFLVADVARQVVGVGSVGMLVYLVLLVGPRGEPLFLQVKQATASVYEEHLGRSPYENHAERVINGKFLIQSASDMLAGWTRCHQRDFYVRQLRDMKVIPDTRRIRGILAEFATACGTALAKAHARSGDAVAIDAYLGRSGSFDEAMARFARSYADRTAEDHALLRASLT